MKKILLFASALAGLFFAASCQQENLEPVGGNTVTYTVQVPDALATKALGDDVSNVNIVHYEVYRTAEANTVDFTGTDNLLYHKTAPMTAGTATINLELVNDQNYTVLFWAQVGVENEAYDVTDLTNVTVKTDLYANKVDYAAFAGRDFIVEGKNLAGRTVTLTRPISQINIATTPESLKGNGAFIDDVVLEGSSVTVIGLSNSFDVANQAANAEMEATYEFDEQDVPTETLEVNYKDYTYVAMNYVGFADALGTQVTVSYVINTTEGNIDNEIKNVPVKPNYRTNIVGNLITSTSDYTITLEDKWAGVADEMEIWDGKFISAPAKNDEGEYEVTKPSELAWLAAAVNGTIETRATEPAKTFAGETFVLTENIDLGNFPWTPIGLKGDVEGFKGTFDGNGKTISNLYVDLSAERKNQSAGLFGSVRYATIKNFTVKNATIKNLDVIGDSSNGAAVVVGAAQFDSQIENVHVVNATVSANKRAAGIAGYLKGSIKECTVDGLVAVVTPDKKSDGSYDNGDKVGGILGVDNTGTDIDNCTVRNSYLEGYRDLGGIAAVAHKSITNCTVENVDIVHNPLNGYKTSVDTFGAIHSGRVTPSGDVTTGNQVINVTIYAPENVTIVEPGESLQAAIDAAVAPAVIYLAEGTHTGHTVINKEITLLPVEGAKVVYDGHLHINNTTAVIKNITLTNEHPSTTTVQASGDAHLSCASSYSSNVTMENCTFDIKKDPAASRAQYGFYNYQGVSEQIVIKDCTFNCNGERPLYTRTIVEVDGCKFYDQYRYAIQVAGELPAQQQVVTFTNNQIINPCITSGKGFVAGVSISKSHICENVTFNIANNTLQSSLFPSIYYVYDNSDNIDMASCTVNGATFVREDKIEMAYKVSNDAELAKAITSATDKGLTIILADGTYNNDINLTVAALGGAKGDLKFKAAEGAEPVIAGTVTLGYRDQGVGAALWDGNVTFEGIKFDHSEAEKHSISVGDVKSLTLTNCTIIGDGEKGIDSARGNGTGVSKIEGCTFVNAAMQILGNFGTGLVIDGCTFNESRINVQAGNGVTVQNCTFNNTLKTANVGDSFYCVRSNSTPITVKETEINIDSELAEVATSQSKWYLLANRGTTNWTVENVAVTLSNAALMQTELDITACTSTGVINTTNLTVNGIVQ